MRNTNNKAAGTENLITKLSNTLLAITTVANVCEQHPSSGNTNT